MAKKYLLVDLFSGSYNKENIGHELFNDQKNSVTGKYYGYLPPRDNPNIQRLGASGKDTYIDDILVIFATKDNDKSIDRRIIGFYPSARIYKKYKSGESLERNFLDKDGLMKTASYSIESEAYHPVSEDAFPLIKTREYEPYLFRYQRVYEGTYPDLDLFIYEHFAPWLNGEKQEEDTIEQWRLQGISGASEQIVKDAPGRQPVFESQASGKRVQRNSKLAKSAIIASNFQCEVNSNHETFCNKQDKPFMEGHHLIPCTVENAQEIWERFERNIDCTENIVSLCPTCHRAIHMGNQEAKKKVLSALISKRLPILKEIGIDITEEYLLNLYGV